MNPSASGWIKKFLNEFSFGDLVDHFKNETNFYKQLKKSGFIYGVSVKTLLDEPISHLKLTKEEYTKINLFHSLLYAFFMENPERKMEDAIETIVDYYQTIGKGRRNFLQKLTLNKSKSDNLEKILSSRLQETNTLLKNSSAAFLTYSLLYVDILSFHSYMRNPKGLIDYTEALERTLLLCSFIALQSKRHKNKYDIQLIELFESSSEYASNEPTDSNLKELVSSILSTELEKEYLLDICSLAIWDDQVVDDSELSFLKKLSKALQFEEKKVYRCLSQLERFSVVNATSIQMFEYAHPVQQFYKQSSETVKLLIMRNKRRLLKELDESGELLVLLSQSTVRELNSEEKTKVKEQLLDICRTIPSLTIFMLPGGTLLMPLLVKFIPKLLPSAFAENRIEKDKSED